MSTYRMGLLIGSLLMLSCQQQPSSINEVLVHLDCKTQENTPAFFINGIYSNCSENTNVYWFDSVKVKTEHIKLCKLSNSNVLKEGKNWAQYEPKCFTFL